MIRVLTHPALGHPSARTPLPMILCHCSKVTDRAIESAIDSGAATLDEIGELTGAGECCGGCVPAVAEVIARRIPLRVIDSDALLAAE